MHRHLPTPILLAALALTPAAAQAAPQVTSAAGADPAAIQASVDAFRAQLGTLNPNNGTAAAGGRREINWDGVPDNRIDPFPGGFFSGTSPRGIQLTTPGTALKLSAKAPAPVRFAEINAGYDAQFRTFSAERLFTPIGSTITDATFHRADDSARAASTTAFGAVFTDVEKDGAASLEFFDRDGQSLGRWNAPAGASGGLSFLGVRFVDGELPVRVRIVSGEAPLGAAEADKDLVALDDFLYAEPQALSPRPAPEPVVKTVTVEKAAPPTPDTTAPSLSLAAFGGRLKVGLPLVIGSSESATADLKLSRGATILVQRKGVRLAAGATVLKLKGRLARRSVLKLSVVATDAAGNRTTKTLSLTARP